MSPQDARTSARAAPVREQTVAEPKRTERTPEVESSPLTTLSQIAALQGGNAAEPGRIRPDAVLTLQARAGNAAVVSLLRPLASRRASSLVQRRAGLARRRTGTSGRPAAVAQRAPAATATATASAPAKESSEVDDVDTSEFTDDPKAAAAKLAGTKVAAPPTPSPPPLPAPVAKPQVVKKAGGPLKVAAPSKKASGPVGKAPGKPTSAPVAGEIVKRPTPPLPPKYRYTPGADVPPPPAMPQKVAPGSDPAVRKVMLAAKKTVKATKKHPTGRHQSEAALASAKSPANEQQASAEAVRTGEMEAKATPKPFNEAAFVDAVMVEIEKTKPKNLEESGQVENKAEHAKGAIGKQVGVHKEVAAGSVEKEAEKPAKLADGENRKEQPLPALQVDQPGGLKASSAMPAPLPNQSVDFRHGPASVDKEMADADITEKQLAESNEPEFLGALDAKKENAEHAKAMPAELRKSETDILKKAQAQTASAEKSAVSGAQTTIGGSTKAIAASKKTTVDKDEAERKKVADGINGIFMNTQKDVAGILTALDTTVDDLFTKAEKAIRESFTYDWQCRLESYKDARYSGIRGKGRWLRDKFKGLPPKAKELFAKSQAMYERMMRKLVKRIAGIVSAELTKATNRIKTGREEVVSYVKGLKGDQAKFGAEAAKEISEKFDQLDADVTEKFDEMASTVAKKYNESRSAIDAELKDAWDAEKGLIDKAIDKIKGVYNAIKELKDLFLRVLKKISDVIGTILAHPIRFLQNFFSAVKDGVTRFKDNIVDHMKSGLMGWLTGNLGKKGIDIPDTFDLPSMGKLVLSVFGLSWTFLRERLEARVGEGGMAALESGASIVGKLKDGPVALWEMVSERFTEFKDLVIGKIQDYIENKVVIAGITFLISMLNPASAFIKACKMIYDVISFIIEKGKQIGEFVESIIDAAGDIARGGGGGVPEKIEGVLAKALPLALGFCASLLSLGGIGDKVRDIIDKVRKPIFRAVDKVIDFVVKTTRPIWEPAKRLFDRGMKKGKAMYAAGKKKVKAGVDKVKTGAKKVKDKVVGFFKPQVLTFAMNGAKHTLAADGTSPGISMASKKQRLAAKIGSAVGSLIAQERRLLAAAQPSKEDEKQAAAVKIQHEMLKWIGQETKKGETLAKEAAALPAGAAKEAKEKSLKTQLAEVAKLLSDYGETYRAKDVVVLTDEHRPVEVAGGPEAELNKRFGMTVEAAKAAMAVAAKFGVVIYVRNTNQWAPALRAKGLLPKPYYLKMKTINRADLLLAAHAGIVEADLGKVGYFKPRIPDRANNMNDKQWQALMERFAQRDNEYVQEAEQVKKYSERQEAKEKGKFRDPVITVKDGKVRHADTGTEFAGDYDLFAIVGIDGSELDAKQKKRVWDALRGGPFQAMHGAHVDWRPHDPKDIAIRDVIVAKHKGGDPLLRVTPDGCSVAYEVCAPEPQAEPVDVKVIADEL